MEKVRQIAMDYAANILEHENEMDIDVIRYLLNDLLPLKEVHLVPDEIVAGAVASKNLPWRLEGTTYRRTGEHVAVLSWENHDKERKRLAGLSAIVSEAVAESRSIALQELPALLTSKGFPLEEGESIESMIEMAIGTGMFDGYVDAASGRVHRNDTPRERYQKRFMEELDVAATALALDGEPAPVIPPAIESVLVAPKKPKSLDGLLDVAEARSRDVEAFIATFCKQGRKVSLDAINQGLHQHFKEQHVDLPWMLEKGGVEAFLEDMVKHDRIRGYFSDDDHFVREA